MRPLFKNDILRVSKDFNYIKCWGVYFLIDNNDVVYVGYSEQPLHRLFTHKNRFKIDRYHVIYFKTQNEALHMEKEYIRTFKPIYNLKDNIDSPIRLEKQQTSEKEGKDNTEGLKMAMTAIKINWVVNILNNTYIKKKDKYYFRVDNDIYELNTVFPYFYLCGKKYKVPTKLFGSTSELIAE